MYDTREMAEQVAQFEETSFSFVKWKIQAFMCNLPCALCHQLTGSSQNVLQERIARLNNVRQPLFFYFLFKLVPALAFPKYRGFSLVSVYVDSYTASALSTEKLSGSSCPSRSGASTWKRHTKHPKRGGADRRVLRVCALSQSDLKSHSGYTSCYSEARQDREK